MHLLVWEVYRLPPSKNETKPEKDMDFSKEERRFMSQSFGSVPVVLLLVDLYIKTDGPQGQW